MTTTTAPTLFDRLGGMVSIDAAVELFYDRAVGDPELAHFFDQVDLRRQRSQSVPRHGSAAHVDTKAEGWARRTHLRLTDLHVDLVAGHLAAVLAGLGVSPTLIDDVVSAIDGLRDTVLGRT